MPASYTIDLVDGADYSRAYGSDGLLSESASRVAIVRGLTGDATASTALAAARTLVQAAYPVGTPYDATDAPLCLVVGYRVEGMGSTDDMVRVRVLYSTPNLSYDGDEIQWIVEDDTEEQSEPTQIDPASGEPLILRWSTGDPGDPNRQVKTDVATMSGGVTVNRLVLTAVMPTTSVPTYRAAVNTVNDATFLTYGIGHWKFARFNTTRRRGANLTQGRAELIGKESQDWRQYEIYRDPDGKYVLPAAGVIPGILAAGYTYGKVEYNGVLSLGRFPLADFSTLFANLL